MVQAKDVVSCSMGALVPCCLLILFICHVDLSPLEPLFVFYCLFVDLCGLFSAWWVGAITYWSQLRRLDWEFFSRYRTFTSRANFISFLLNNLPFSTYPSLTSCFVHIKMLSNMIFILLKTFEDRQSKRVWLYHFLDIERGFTETDGGRH